MHISKVEIKTGEEDEDAIYKARSKLYRFREKECKEKGTGYMKLLRHKTEKRIRFILRQNKTLKMLPILLYKINHYVIYNLIKEEIKCFILWLMIVLKKIVLL